MIPLETVIVREIPVIQKIIRDETWLESERRGCHVTPDDVVVRENVCRVVLQVGQKLRESVTHAFPRGGVPGASMTVAFAPLELSEGADWQI